MADPQAKFTDAAHVLCKNCTHLQSDVPLLNALLPKVFSNFQTCHGTARDVPDHVNGGEKRVFLYPHHEILDIYLLGAGRLKNTPPRPQDVNIDGKCPYFQPRP
ncbi:MAG: hypothetical protein WBK91_01820 [Alphaproteobacteria bacterium]